ncbi:MAG: HutP family protein [Bacillota bacterium]
MESIDVARAAIQMALTKNRQEEMNLKELLKAAGIRAAAVDLGGDFMAAVKTTIERALVAAKREGLIHETHTDEGAVAGAAREAMSQVIAKGFGLNVGGKIGLARRSEHLIVAVFFAVGLIHLNEVAIGLGHRAIPVRG